MSAMSDYLENKLIDLAFRGGTFTGPANVYIALFTAAPSDSGGGTEVSGGSYARVAVAADNTHWQDTAGGTAATSSGTTGTTKNVGAIAFPTATANWGTVTHVGIFDASSAGNLLWWGALTATQNITTGVAYLIGATSLSIQVDN